MRAARPEESYLERYIEEMEKDPEWLKLDEILDNEELLERVGEAFPEVFIGRDRLPVEVTLRSTLWKKRYGMSYRGLAHDMGVNLEAQWFCRVRKESGLPSFSCLQQNISMLDEGIWKKINGWIVKEARRRHKSKGIKSRKDSTVVEANVRYPTDGGILIDGIRVVVREVKKVVGKEIPKGFRSFKRKLKGIRDRLRYAGRRGKEEVKGVLVELSEIAEHVLRTTEGVVGEKVDQMRSRLSEVVEQTKRVIAGEESIPHRIVSFFEEYARPIKRGKAGVSCEFGLGLQIQEDELLITDWEIQEKIDDEGSIDRGLDRHEQLHGHPPRTFSADSHYGNEKNKTWERLKERGIKEVSIPYRGKVKDKYGGERFKELQRWRSGCEGTISVLKRLGGLDKIRERGEDGFRKGVSMGIVTHNFWRLARALG